MEKFEIKNVDSFNNLNTYIDDNKSKIRFIVASFEMGFYLRYSNECEIVKPNSKTKLKRNDMTFNEYCEVVGLDEVQTLYKGIKVIIEPYQPSHLIGFVMRDNNIEFNLPCVCGIYKDEVHP